MMENVNVNEILADELLPLANSFDEVYESIIHSNYSEKVKLGFDYLDEALPAGIMGSTLTLVGAPGSGKSTVAINIGVDLASRGVDVFYISCDISKKQIVEMLIQTSYYSLCTYDTKEKTSIVYRLNSLSEKEQNILDEAIIKLKTGALQKFHYVDGNAFNMEYVLLLAERFRAEGKKAVFIIDYLQQLKINDSFNTDKQKVDMAMSTAHSLKQMGMGTIILSSTKKENYSKIKANKVVGKSFKSTMGLDSPKDSGNIEYLSDAAVALEKVEYNFTQVIGVNILKARDGKAGNCYLIDTNFQYKYIGKGYKKIDII